MIQHTGNFPTISIIIVNYNGRHLLKECFSSLRKLTYPQENIEIIMVDNNSSDDSIPYVRKSFPEVKIISNESNAGFTGGNISGFSAATGEYIVLLNSDVVVDKHWLSALVKAARPSDIGIVSSRLRYATPFIPISIESVALPKSRVYRTIDHSPIGVLIEEIKCQTPELSELVYYKSGFYDRKDGEICTRRTKGNATVLLPFLKEQDHNHYSITLHGLETSEDIITPVKIRVGEKLIKEIKLEPHQAVQVVIKINKNEIKNSLIWLVQNAGNIVLHSGYSKDRGSVVVMRDTEQKEFYEEESAYFNKPSELLAACGASCLIKRKVIENIGFLDGYYFMYYEDVEFSIRAWKAGWNILYEPTSIGYHKHRATTGASESAFFLKLVEQNHISLVITHFPLSTVIIELLQFIARTGLTFVKFFIFQFRDNETRATTWRRKWEGRYEALKFLFREFLRLIISRNKASELNSKERLSLKKMLY